MGVIFIDSNVPMYLVGEAHPLKTESRFCLSAWWLRDNV